jgi:hypothetical protein
VPIVSYRINAIVAGRDEAEKPQPYRPIDELPNPAAIAYFSAGQVTDQGRTMA